MITLIDPLFIGSIENDGIEIFYEVPAAERIRGKISPTLP